MKATNKSLYILLFVLALAVNFAGIGVKFFTDDPGLYASIAKYLIYKKDIWQLYTYNRDWLDKPHFPFWAIFVSFKLFGISEFAYRLPALLFFMLGLLYTYLFARKYYNREIAIMAVLILLTALNTILGNTDTRAEPYLMGLIIAGIYHIACLEERFSYKDLLLAALFTAFAIMTKGIFVVVAIYGSLIGQLVFQKRLKSLFQAKWLWLIVLTAIFTLPEFYALYIQFDLHPEKTVFGTTHVSGIKWFLWDSQFGRFVNNGPIIRKTSGSIIFYVHTLLWAFAPWCLLFYYAVFKNLKAIFQRSAAIEYYALSGGLLLLLLFSVSRFQLPFYTNAVFPLFAIVTAPFCFDQLSKFGTKFRLISQWAFVILLPAAVIFLHILLKPAGRLFFIVDLVWFGALMLIIAIKIREAHLKVFFFNCTAALFAGFYINAGLYNEILPYKGQIKAAEYLNLKPFSGFHLYVVNAENNIFQFYCKRPVDLVPEGQFNNFKPAEPSIFYVNQRSMDYLKQTHADFKIIRSFLDYPTENIQLNFINKATRDSALGHVYLITK
jgi:4-amino-4-deoxy-L-arabinose transferase-like glycosyltransferase